jgi:hypothetical protein
MVSFDFSNEIFFSTTFPSFDFDGISSITSLEHRKFERNLVVLNGYAAFICTILRTTYLHIRVLGELGVAESWTKLFVVGSLPCIERPLVAGIKKDFYNLLKRR